MMVAAVPASAAMVREFQAAARNRGASTPVNRSAYQRSDTPPQLVSDVLSLKE